MFTFQCGRLNLKILCNDEHVYTVREFVHPDHADRLFHVDLSEIKKIVRVQNQFGDDYVVDLKTTIIKLFEFIKRNFGGYIFCAGRGEEANIWLSVVRGNINKAVEKINGFKYYALGSCFQTIFDQYKQDIYNKWNDEFEEVVVCSIQQKDVPQKIQSYDYFIKLMFPQNKSYKIGYKIETDWRICLNCCVACLLTKSLLINTIRDAFTKKMLFGIKNDLTIDEMRQYFEATPFYIRK